MRTFEINGSNGTITAEEATGKVINTDDGTRNPAAEYENILQFDVAEYRRHYSLLPSAALHAVDILCIGYWYEDWVDGSEKYEEPVHEYRNV